MSNETLLIVEDNNVLRDGLKAMLSFEGYQICTAGNGLEALTEMHGATPDLILSDIAMPEMDGFAFFEEVRARPEWVSIPFIFLTARSEPEDIMMGRNLGAEDYLVKPLTREELVTTIRSRLIRSQQVKVAQLEQAYQASLTTLANAIDLRDRYTRGHVERVTAYSLAIARQQGWKEWEQKQLRLGATLHDIGKIHIPEKTLFKSSELTREEWEEVKRHPIIGAEMIRDIPYLAPAVPVIRHHHERWDGLGYPDGLIAEAIPPGARIVSVADAFDAITTERPYSPPLSIDRAYQEILSCVGTHYDPAVVEAFQRAWQSSVIQGILEDWNKNSPKRA